MTRISYFLLVGLLMLDYPTPSVHVGHPTMNATPTVETVQFTTKGQVVIPARVRRHFQIEDGTRASVITTDDGILLKPITHAYIRSLRGKHKNLPLMETLAEDRKRERTL